MKYIKCKKHKSIYKRRYTKLIIIIIIVTITDHNCCILTRIMQPTLRYPSRFSTPAVATHPYQTASLLLLPYLARMDASLDNHSRLPGCQSAG